MRHFKNDTYIVLDLPKTIADKVKRLRVEYWYTMSLPVEITVAGSSGVGVLQKDQNPNDVYRTIKDIAARTKPIKCVFGEVSRFPKTDIFFFTLQDESYIQEFHEQFVNSDIKFSDNPFPYKPHCTLCNNSSLTDIETQELLSKEISDEFIIKELSVYSLERTLDEEINVSLVERFWLTRG